jgi:hypothetical protein
MQLLEQQDTITFGLRVRVSRSTFDWASQHPKIVASLPYVVWFTSMIALGVSIALGALRVVGV